MNNPYTYDGSISFGSTMSFTFSVDPNATTSFTYSYDPSSTIISNGNSAGYTWVSLTEDEKKLILDEKEYDYRVIIGVLEFLLDKVGIDKDILEMSYDDFSKLVDRDQKINDLLDGESD